jgi:hypothetical protein
MKLTFRERPTVRLNEPEHREKWQVGGLSEADTCFFVTVEICMNALGTLTGTAFISYLGEREYIFAGGRRAEYLPLGGCRVR